MGIFKRILALLFFENIVGINAYKNKILEHFWNKG